MEECIGTVGPTGRPAQAATGIAKPVSIDPGGPENVAERRTECQVSESPVGPSPDLEGIRCKPALRRSILLRFGLDSAALAGNHRDTRSLPEGGTGRPEEGGAPQGDCGMGESTEGLQPSTDARPDHGDLIDLLEERLRDLVDRYQTQRRSIAELRAQAKEQDRRINELEARVYALNGARATATKRLDKLIAEIDRRERSAEAGS